MPVIRRVSTQAQSRKWTRMEYLENTSVQAFVSYLRDLVKGVKSLDHSYRVDFPRWRKALSPRPASDRWDPDQKILRLKKFSDAFEEYFWIAEESEEEPEELEPTRTSYDQSQRILDALGQEIKDALTNDPEQSPSARVLVAAIKILDWGQVYRGSLTWLLKQYDRAALEKKLLRAGTILDGDDSTPAEEFRSALRMDSGLTKVFSLASNRTIIYDDRVGAAFCLLVLKFMETAGTKHGSLPSELAFMPGRQSRRNPSTATTRFPGRGRHASYNHAVANLRANWILRAVLEDKDLCHSQWTLRKLEAALFMIGYAVKQ